MAADLRPPYLKECKGGGISWHFNVAWEISRFQLNAKFSHAKFRVLCEFLAH